jgi:hypothetical protein
MEREPRRGADVVEVVKVSPPTICTGCRFALVILGRYDVDEKEPWQGREESNIVYCLHPVLSKEKGKASDLYRAPREVVACDLFQSGDREIRTWKESP